MFTYRYATQEKIIILPVQMHVSKTVTFIRFYSHSHYLLFLYLPVTRYWCAKCFDKKDCLSWKNYTKVMKYDIKILHTQVIIYPNTD